MKKRDAALTIMPVSVREESRTARLLTGGVLVLGLWAMGRGMLSWPALAAGLAALALWVLLWERPWALLGAGLAALAAGFFCREAIAQGLGAMGNEITWALTARTGYYFHSFETSGATVEAAAAVGVLLGLLGSVTAAVPVVTAVVFAGVYYGILEGGIGLVVYLLGLVLVLAKDARLEKRLVTALLAAAVMVCFTNFAGTTPEWAAEALHAWQYGHGAGPMPEGQIAGAEQLRTSGEAALEVTMDEWSGLYLRGFTGSVWTGSGWEPPAGETVADSADLLYTLQKGYFYPEHQLSAAFEAAEQTRFRRITVKNTGACTAWGYLPPGLGGVEMDARDLDGQAMEGYSGTLYPVEEAYLIQKILSDGDASDYTDAEAAYREWVYEHYMEAPEGLPTAEGALTTTEAKELVLTWLEEMLRYDETAVCGDDPVAELLGSSPYGWSIHYATLGALAMRSLGVPARYVEGYHIPKGAAAELAPGQSLTVTMEYAHAWVEYYLDGVGWVPFEVTPGHENELVYALPPDGSGVQEPDEPETTEPEEPPVKQQPDPGSQTKLHRTGFVLNLLLILLALAVVGWAIRVFLLRKRLKERLDRFRENADRETMLDCLGYQQELLETMGLEAKNRTILQQEMDISQILTGIDVRAVLLTAQELSFSHHPVTEEQHALVLAALEEVRKVWRQQTKKGKRFSLRFIRCRIY